MSKLKESLQNKVQASLNNNYGIENYSEYRFGKFSPQPLSLKNELKRLVKKILNYTPDKQIIVNKVDKYIAGFSEDLENLYNNINDKDKELLVSLLAYRLLGYKKVKLPRNNAHYWKAIEKAKSIADPNDTYDPNFIHFILNRFDLKPIGYDISFYFSITGVVMDYIIEQYAYSIDNKKLVSVEKDDIVLDLGACWGDTALYFAHHCGDNGKVYSFEFIPGNIKLFHKNLALNPKLASRINLVEHPVSNVSNDKIYFKDRGPGSQVKFEPFDDQTGITHTVSIDDFVTTNNIERVDFIKMDIEGAEPLALEGAINTIKKHRPKLAIAIYHSLSDFAKIPNWILNLDLDYEIFIDHFTIHAEETICFAKPR
ncbi:FkbM family methyltransferase [Winogradskyella haliclonae]|uniref:Methyltransferase FkbM domain-containing protein n=1 Tax=Winogradskyella haliclonae TaxID=2048558 RepID=A0ABQ2C2Q1_9FLAO|nr:FkbM family methyltransferase [Winogradskyella haliclonae]GGI58047.1 hypothetical protein GCM10011444_23560 [Winogradskyella haliclonae]